MRKTLAIATVLAVLPLAAFARGDEPRRWMVDEVVAAGETGRAGPVRSQLIERLPRDDTSVPLPSADLLSEQLDSMAHRGWDPPLEPVVNPEPSSLLVWVTTAVGLLAAGYGCRHRSRIVVSEARA